MDPDIQASLQQPPTEPRPLAAAQDVVPTALDISSGPVQALSTPENGARASRQRSSLPATATPPVRTLRGGAPKDIEKILHRLGPSGVADRKERSVTEKEGELREVVDGHDTAVLEKFHLEKYISLLEGWDPVVSSSTLLLKQADR